MLLLLLPLLLLPLLLLLLLLSTPARSRLPAGLSYMPSLLMLLLLLLLLSLLLLLLLLLHACRLRERQPAARERRSKRLRNTVLQQLL